MSKNILNRLPGFFFNAHTIGWICPIRSVIVSLAIFIAFQSLIKNFAIVSNLEPILSADST